MSFRLALLMMDAIALWQREGMSSRLGVFVSWRTVVASTWVGLVAEGCWGGEGLSCWGVRNCWLVVLRSRVGRLTCLSSELVSGVCSLLGSGDVGRCAIGQRDFASSW